MFKSRSLRVLLLGVAMSAVSFTGVRAADEPPKPAPTDRPARRTPADMIKNYRDQFEGLNLTDDQMKKLDGFIETAEGEIKKAGDGQDGRRAAFTALGKLREDVNSVLTDTQKAALGKKRQAEMVDRFKAPYANPELKLTDDQKTKIDGIMADAAKQLSAITPSTTGGRPDRESYQKIGEIMRGAREKANALLTPDQQKLIPAFGGRGNRGNRGGGATPPTKTNT